MTTAVYSYEVAWTSQLAGVFIIGTSTIGGTDTLGGDFGNNTFDEITPDVMSCDITSGRDSDLSSMQQGMCTLILKDPTGKYNPENASSTLNGKLLPLRPVRVKATFSGTDYGLFYGYISRIEYDPEARQSTIEAVDLFEWLSTYSPSIGTVTNYTVSQIIGLILDSIGWTDPTLRSIETGGNVIPSWSADGNTTSLGLIQTLLSIDLGIFFISKSGVATYKTRNIFYSNEAAVATISGSLSSSLKTSVEKDKIINGQYALRTGGVATFATNTESRKAYGYRNGSPVTSAQFESDTAAASFANFVVALNGTPRSPTRNIALINRDDTTLTQQLTREIGDMVNVTESTGSTSFKGRVQGMRHSISNAGTLHTTNIMVQKVVLSVFTIGVSVLDGVDVIGY